jgi:UDP-3-O-[3-hydroxymyristoyl] glucosamine N-acyltransferase
MHLADIQRSLGGELIGEVSAPLAGVGALESAEAGRITFLANPRYRTALARTRRDLAAAHRRR